MVRRDVAAEKPDKPARAGTGDVHHGPWRQYYYANARGGTRHRETRAVGGLRSISDRVVGAVGAQERHLSLAGVHQFRNGWLAHRFEPFAAMGRENRGAGV